MDFQFMPLDLWRASSLSQETKNAITAYEQCLSSGDMESLAVLRKTIEDRIDALEPFFTANLADQRSILFEKQRMKLRRLLHEYDQAVASLSSSVGPDSRLNTSTTSPRNNAYLNSPSYSTRQISESSRLNLAELQAWLLQNGRDEMPEVSESVVEKIFGSVTRTNLDGKMSVKDLRQWYISYGKSALRNGKNDFDGDLVPLTLFKAPPPKSKTLPPVPRGLYAWEEGSSPSKAEQKSTEPLGLPNEILEFQIRLTPEEYKQMQLTRRRIESELRFKERIELAKKLKPESDRAERPHTRA